MGSFCTFESLLATVNEYKFEQFKYDGTSMPVQYE